MPAPPQLQHRRAHNLLLISKLLSCRENASPFTLIIDSLEQSGKGLVREYVRRANTAKTKVVFVSFETLRKPKGVDVFIPAASQNPMAVQKEIANATGEVQGRQKTLLIIDTLHPLISHPTTANSLPAFLSSFTSPTTSLLATFHADIPLSASAAQNPYAPHPLTLLKYMSTTILTTHSLPHILAEKAARDRSLAGPVFGLSEEIEGVIAGLGRNGWSGSSSSAIEGSPAAKEAAAALGRGVVIEMEYRRKSGRGVREWFFLPTPGTTKLGTVTAAAGTGPVAGARPKETAILLEDHPLYRYVPGVEGAAGAAQGEDMDVSFNLGLTDKQRRDREGVVLPYFDAQREEGPGEGGRILYDMGVEDDFDEEEDEI